jgi:magnesium transporter
MVKGTNNIQHKKETAGRLMSTLVPAINENSTISDIENMLLNQTNNFDSINYVYLVNDEYKLKGAISIKEIFRQTKDKLVSRVMQKTIVSVRPTSDQEKVVKLALKHSLKNIPVVDDNGRFLGSVLSDRILSILQHENLEDALKAEGIRKLENPAKDLISASSAVYFKKRLPWLLVGLAGGVMAALVVERFEQILSQMIILAAFIPAVVYMADAVGAQSQTIFVRSLAVDEEFNLDKYIRREWGVGLLLSFVLALIIGFFSLYWWQSWLLGLILTISFFLTILMAIFSAVFLPWLFNRFRIDPAVAAGPFATVVRDILSIAIYFSVAYVLITLLA